MNNIFKYKIISKEIAITGLQKGVATTSIVIPETIDGMPVVEIGPEAFSFTSIMDIKIGKNIREIREKAFYMCKKLRSVTWNQKCDVVPAFCFSECSNLTKFDFSNVKKIGLYAFYKSGLQEVCLQKNIKVLEEGTFSGCSKLQSVTWHCQCDMIPTFCFDKCSNLTQFDFSNIKRIEVRAFRDSGLTSVTLNEETEVGECCFSNCNDLEKIEWLSGRSIEGDIFEECQNIKEIIISDNVMGIAVDAFASSPNAEISFI